VRLRGVMFGLPLASDRGMSVWGLGLGRACLERGRGGLSWLENVVGLFEESGLNWILLAYRDEFFGVAATTRSRRCSLGSFRVRNRLPARAARVARS
jgi:hypothetical protein